MSAAAELCSRCGEPLTENERYLEGVGGSYVRCDKCVGELTGARHGAPAPVDPTVFLGPDPPLALTVADLDVWLAAHPCDCEARCDCDTKDEA